MSGIGSGAGDTIIGQVGTHHLQVIDTSGNGTSGTFSLNGGQAVNFTNMDTNIPVDGLSGERVYLDASAIFAWLSSISDSIC